MSHEKMPSIPTVEFLDADVKAVVRPIKEILEVREGRVGSNKSRVVTFGDLVDLGLITESQIPEK